MRIPLITALLLCIAAILSDLYIYLEIRRTFPRLKRPLTAYAIFAAAGWALLAICLLRPRRDADVDISFQMWGLYGFLTLLVPKALIILWSAIGMIPRLWKGKSWHLGKWVGVPLGAIVFITMWWGALVTRHEIEVREVEFASVRVPEGFDGYRIAQISDLHVGTWGDDTSFIEALVDSVNAQKPDIIMFTGDIVNRDTREMEPFLHTLSRLHAPDGVYSILGNHDYGDYVEWPTPADKRDNLRLLKNWQRQIGWRMLNNTHTDLVADADTIRLIGVENWGEPPFHQYGHLTDAYPIDPHQPRHLNDSAFKILLSHNPEHWRREVTKVSNIDLTLSGHTHAMQTELRMFGRRWSPAVWKYEEWGGLYTKQNPRGEDLSIYVNVGAGEVGMPFRVGAKPEVTVITLRKTPGTAAR